MRNAFTLIVAAALVAGCATTPATSTPAPANPDGGTCSDTSVQSYVGQTYTDALGAEMQAKSGAQSLRVVRDGEMVTMEYNGNRLTVSLDAAGKVRTARCG